MSDLQDRLEQLARRGTPRGADAVLDAAKTDVEHDAVTAIGMEPPTRRNPGRHMSSLVAAAGVAATIFVLMLAFSAFIGAGSGADSPEGAVQQLGDAVNNEDPLAAADVLAPEEVRSLSQTLDGAAKRAQELQLARSAAAPLSGLDLSVDNLQLSSETLADGYVKVTVSSGTLTTNTEKDRFAPVMQRALRNSGDGSSHVDLASLAKSNHLPTFVMAVERDGHWYVSAAYTTLEYIREANDLPPADFGSSLAATPSIGADSPDLAVTEAMQALAQRDWTKLISLAPPDEVPVYDYRDALTQLGRDSKHGFTIDKMDTSATVDGDTAKVSLHASGTTDSGHWSLDGACFKPPLGDGSVVQPTSSYCGPDPLFVLPYYFAQPSTALDAKVTVVRKDGRWFVSPVGTVLDLLDRYVHDATQRQLYTLLGVPQELPPDGTLTLGQPVTPPDALGGGASVYALHAHRGDRLLGLLTTETPSEGLYGGGEVLVYSPEGELLQNSYDLIDGAGMEIPADGTYKIVVRPYYEQVTFTVWDEAQAPDAAKHPPTEGMYEGCHPTSNGGEVCSSSTSVGSSSSSSSSASGELAPPALSVPTGQCHSEPFGMTVCTDSSSGSASSGSASRSATATTSTSVPGG